MKSYIRRILFVFICSVCFNVLIMAQVVPQDTVNILQEHTMHVAYGTQPAKLVTSAISTVNGDELLNSFTPDLGNTLYGKISGLTVNQSGGEPGLDSPTLYGRGLNTFGTGTDILVIIDGFESSYNNLVPYEIESVTLLKDASATAMFGSKGANGVLLVTTKRGKAGPMKVNFAVQHGFSSPTALPKFLGSYDYARLYNEGLVNDGEPEFYTPEDLEAYKNQTDPYFHPDVNWYNEVLRKSVPLTNYDLNFSGGDNSIRYFFMLNVLNNNGLYKKVSDQSKASSINSNYRRFNFRSNIDINIGRRLSAAVTFGGSIEQKDNPYNNYTSSMFSNLSKIPPNAFPVFNPNGSYGSSLLYSNPLGDIQEKGLYTSSGRTYQAILKLTQQLDMITPGLSASGAITFSNYFNYFSNKSRDYLRYSLSKNTLDEVEYIPIGQSTSLASDESQWNLWRSFAVQGFLNYNRTFGLNKVDAVVMAFQKSYSDGISLPYASRGVSGRATFSNRDKYIGELSFGYHGTDAFQTGSNWGFFPAASVGWIVSNENFLRRNSFVNFLKIRGSYGLTGNDDIGGTRFPYYQNYSGGAQYYLGSTNVGSAVYGEGEIANVNATWEKQKQLNLGFEATFLNMLDFTFDYFNQDRYDILTTPYETLPLFLGMSLPQLNAGKTNNKGFESTIRYRSNESKDLQYFVKINLSYAKNKIVYQSEAIQLYDYLYRTGQRINQAFLFESVGFFQDTDDIESSPVQPFQQVVPGDLKYKDQNGDNIIDSQDVVAIGNGSLPDLTAGVNIGFKYKGFDIDAMFQGVSGRSVYLYGDYFYAFQNNAKISEMALGRWTPETASTATYPRLSASNNLNNYRGSSFWMRNGNFVRLRSIELGYSLPQSLTSRVNLDESRIFINGTNLFSWDHMDFTDPETITGYPLMKTISIGLRVKM